jgi:hypothetical protein
MSYESMDACLDAIELSVTENADSSAEFDGLFEYTKVSKLQIGQYAAKTLRWALDLQEKVQALIQECHAVIQNNQVVIMN